MPLIRDDDLVRIDLPTPGEWVDVKRALSIGDRKRITGAAMRFRGSIEGDFEIDAGTFEAVAFVGLELGIKAWSFGEPVTPANIRKLSESDYEFITDAANALWDVRSDAEKNGSGGSGATTA